MPDSDKYSVFDRLPWGVRVVDINGRFIYVNDTVARQWKRTKQELIGSTMQDEYPDIAHPDLFRAIKQCHAEQRSITFISEFDFPDGSKGYFKFSIEPVEEGVMILSIDITDIKNAELKAQKTNTELEKALKERATESLKQKKDIEKHQASISAISNFHKAILDNTTSGIILIDRDHKVLCFNKEIRRELFKYFHKDINIGDDYRDFVIESHQQLYLISFDRGIKGEILEVESETIRGNIALWFQYKVNPVYDEWGEILGIALTATNIDERKRKEIALHESELKVTQQAEKIISSEKYYRTLIETSSDAIVLLDIEGKVLYQTDSTQNILGYSLQEIQTIVGIELIHPDDRERVNEDYAKLIAEPQNIIRQRHRVKRKSGNYIWIEATFRNLLDDENIKAIVLNYYDVTDSINARRQLKERVKELTTIYYINEILKDEEQEAEDVLKKVVSVLPPGWQYPEICGAKITFDGQEFQTANYRTSAFTQSELFTLEDNRAGKIEIVYTVQKEHEYEGPFLKEERDLIKAIADTIKVYFNKTYQQRQLVRSEANFRSSFAHAAIGMALVATDGRFLKVNNALCSMVGYSEEELLSCTFMHISHPDHLATDLENVQQILKGSKDFYRIEKKYLHKNGSTIWINLNAAIVRDAKQQPLYFVSQIENITERKESQAKFQDLVEKSLVGVYIIQDDKYAYVNPRIVETSGYSEEELLSMPIETFVHQDDMKAIRENIAGRLTGKFDKARYEVRAFKKNKTMMWLEMFGSVTIYRGAPAIIGTMVDITEKKKVYNELERSEANLRSVFDNSEVLYLLLDVDYTVMALNPYMRDIYCRLTGHTLAVGVNLSGLLLPEKREKALEIYDKVKREKRTVNYETQYQVDSDTKYFWATVVPILTNDEVMGICVSSVDITKLKQLEIENKNFITNLISRNRDLQEFNQIVSHNVRGPLATILGLHDLLEIGVNPEERDYIFQGIAKCAKNLDAVVRELNNILEVKKDSSETKETIRLDEIWNEIKPKFSDLIIKSKAEFVVDFTAFSEFFTMRSYVYNILYNLVSNSLKYRNNEAAPKIAIWTSYAHGEVFLYVKDNGIGIDMNMYGNQIFLLNRRFHNAGDGKGLGLYIVKAQVDILQGSIEIDSEINIGTTVKITLPVH